MSLEVIIQKARALSLEEQKELIKLLVDMLCEPKQETQIELRVSTHDDLELDSPTGTP
jgi:hypothetical protein